MSKYRENLRNWLNDSIEQSINKNDFIKKLFGSNVTFIKGTKELIIIEYIRFQCKRYSSHKNKKFFNPSCREQSLAFEKHNIKISPQWINKVINKYNNILFSLEKTKIKCRFYIQLLSKKLIKNNLFDFSKINLFLFKTKKYQKEYNYKCSINNLSNAPNLDREYISFEWIMNNLN